MTLPLLRSTGIGLAAVVAATGLISAPASATQDPPVPGVPQLDLRPAPETRALGSVGGRLRWRPCLGSAGSIGVRCATLAVPLDHDNPSGPTIRLALSRMRHTVKPRKYQGAVLVNPGGPGGSGLAFATVGTILPRKVAGAYDWIGFDPRGVGFSQPALTCEPGFYEFDRPNYYPRPKANQQAWLQRSATFAQDCERNGDILRHMTTSDNARDMEAIRRALRVKKLNYYGFSYGTYLGQVYATLFPRRVRRMVFDSNVDPRKVFYRANLEQNPANDRVLREWFDWIAEYDALYGLGRSGKAVERRFVRTRNRLVAQPVRGKIGPSEWIDLFLPAAYTTGAWQSLARLWSRFDDGGARRALVDTYEGLVADGTNSTAVYNAVQCTDAPWPSTWSTWSRDNWRSYEKAPLTTWMNAWFNAPCRDWPAPSRQARVDVTGRGVGGGPLLIGGTLDGPTPFHNSKAVKKIFQRSRLVAIQGEVTHAASLDGNRCVLRIVSRYLGTGGLPRRKPGRQPDVRCPALPLPDPIPNDGLG